MESNITNHQVMWRQMLSLALLYASVIIGWIAYYNYQPQLIDRYEFNDLKLFLFVVQGLILVVTPMIAGRLGDKYRAGSMGRLPVISAGVSFAAMVFMATAFTLYTDPGPVFKWVLPVLITLWLFSMALFTSPAISTVELFVPAGKLPTAMAILTLVYGLIYSLEPVIVDLVEYLGAPVTFGVGGAAVFLSGLLMKNKTSPVVDTPISDSPKKSDYSYALALGVLQGLMTTLLFNKVPEWTDSKEVFVFGLSSSQTVSFVLAMVAVFSLPAGKIVQKMELQHSALLSLMLCLVVMLGIYFAEEPAIIGVMLIVFGLCFSLMTVSFLPLALGLINDRQKVLGVGVFFAGVELPNGILEVMLVLEGKL